MTGRHLLILLVAIFAVGLLVYSKDKPAGPPKTSTTELLIRKIGHELLSSAGDDSSRVLPVRQFSPLEFRISFENELSLTPDSIIRIVNATLAKSDLPENYEVRVIDGSSSELVYGFAKGKLEKDNIEACTGRSIPRGHYYIDINFSAPVKPFLSGPRLILGGIGLSAIVLLGFNYYQRTKRKPFSPPEAPTAPVSNAIQIGRTIFYSDQHYIEFDHSKTDLTNKESKLLHIFASSINQMIDRNSLQKEVWENEGVIVTRSLDMFVSKLRKKLSPDDSVKIVNIPGKGYKLEA